MKVEDPDDFTDSSTAWYVLIIVTCDPPVLLKLVETHLPSGSVVDPVSLPLVLPMVKFMEPPGLVVVPKLTFVWATSNLHCPCPKTVVALLWIADLTYGCVMSSLWSKNAPWSTSHS